MVLSMDSQCHTRQLPKLAFVDRIDHSICRIQPCRLDPIDHATRATHYATLLSFHLSQHARAGLFQQLYRRRAELPVADLLQQLKEWLLALAVRSAENKAARPQP